MEGRGPGRGIGILPIKGGGAWDRHPADLSEGADVREFRRQTVLGGCSPRQNAANLPGGVSVGRGRAEGCSREHAERPPTPCARPAKRILSPLIRRGTMHA